MANTNSVPAGKYGKAALTKLGVWDAVKDKIAQADNVRAALQARVDAGRRRSASSTPPTPSPIPTSRCSTSSPKARTRRSSIRRPIVASSTNADAPALLAYLKSRGGAERVQGPGLQGAVELLTVIPAKAGPSRP